MAVPPGRPPDRIQVWREAFEKALHDPELVEKAKKSGMIFRDASGAEMTQLVNDATQMPDDIRQLIISAVRGEL